MLPVSIPPPPPPPLGLSAEADQTDNRRQLFIRVQELTRQGQHAAAEALWQQMTGDTRHV